MYKYVLIILLLFLLISTYAYFNDFNKKNDEIPEFFWEKKIEDFEQILK